MDSTIRFRESDYLPGSGGSGCDLGIAKLEVQAMTLEAQTGFRFGNRVSALLLDSLP